jgi:hypothetical protein
VFTPFLIGNIPVDKSYHGKFESSSVNEIELKAILNTFPSIGLKSRWEDDVRNDLKKMKLMNWAEQVQDRLKWKDIVEKGKTL